MKVVVLMKKSDGNIDVKGVYSTMANAARKADLDKKSMYMTRSFDVDDSDDGCLSVMESRVRNVLGMPNLDPVIKKLLTQAIACDAGV